MAEVQRYDRDGWGRMVKRPDGDWVRFENYDTLRKLCGELNDTLILVRERIDLELEVVPVLWHKSVIFQFDAAITRAQEVLNEPR